MIRTPRVPRKHMANAIWGAVDYAVYPFLMLLVAPVVLHHLGIAEYGIWTVATAVISVGGAIASGFGDANIQRVAKQAADSDPKTIAATVRPTVRSLFGIHLSLGLLLSIAAWIASPVAARHIVRSTHIDAATCLICLRIAAPLILLRALETVAVSTQRAFQRYGPTVRISTLARTVTLALAAALAGTGHGTVSLLAMTACVLFAGVAMQLRGLYRLIGGDVLLPAFHPVETPALLRFGLFTWMQALGSVIFGQLDRVVLGLAMGAAAVAPYALCVQFAHPIAGLTGSTLSFLFPYFSSRIGRVSHADMVRTLWKAFAVNLALVGAGASLLLLFGIRIIHSWAGAAVAHSAAQILPTVVAGSALMGLGVTASCALLAMGVFRTVAVVNLSARAIMLAFMTLLIHHAGLEGLALVRLGYGLFAAGLYIPLFRELRARKRLHVDPSAVPIASIPDLVGGAQP